MPAFLDSLRDLPTPALLPLFWILSVGAVFLGHALARRTVFRAHPPTPQGNAGAAFFGTALMSFFSIVSGLIIVAAWQNYTDTRAIIAQEGAALASLYRDADALPDPESAQVQSNLRTYVEAVAKEDWPAHKAGKSGETGGLMLDHVQSDLQAAGARRDANPIFVGEAYGKFNDLVEQRRLRINAAQVRIPSVFWTILLSSTALALLCFYAFAIPDERLRSILFVLLGLFVGVVLFSVFTLDNPFRGAVRVEPTIYRTLLEAWSR